MKLMNCPLGLNCSDMGLNLSGVGCINKGKCSAIAQTLQDEEHPNPDNINALDVYNPFLSWNESDDYCWQVIDRKDLPYGYAVAQNAKLPCVTVDGIIHVIASDRGYAPAVENPNFFLEIDGSLIVLIEWHNGKLKQIYTQDYQYWCNECKDGSLLCSTDGGDVIESDYWLSSVSSQWKLSFIGNPNIVELRLEQVEQLKTWLENVIICEEQHYCVICQDSVYENNFGSCNCNHIHYINWLGSWGGCGYIEEDLSEHYRVAISKISIKDRNKLKRLLKATNISGLWSFGCDLYGDELEPAIAWIKSLDNDTPNAIAQTLSWLGD